MTHYTGWIVGRIRELFHALPEGNRITLDNHQQNASYGIHQARVQLEGDPTVYRLILAPADAPIEFGGREASTYFSKPLGDG